MRYWFDTEFIEDGKTIDLISIGIVAEDGRELYRQNVEAELDRAHPWVVDNVFPHLHGLVIQGAVTRFPSLTYRNGLSISRADIAKDLRGFCDPDEYGKPEFWAYYADYDWVVLCQLFGTMMDLPEGWPKWCRDIKQLCDNLGNPKLPKQGDSEHHALADARWNKSTLEWLEKHQGSLALAALVKSDVD